MEYLCVLTYDLEKGDSADYKTVNDELEKLGFKREINNKEKKLIDLPDNTFAQKKTSDETRTDTRDELQKEVKKALEKVNLDGKFYLLVTEYYAWVKVKTTKKKK